MGIMTPFLLSYFMFILSLLGVILNRSNIILILICIEIMLLSMTLNILMYSYYQWSVLCHVFSIYIITVAAVESAIGLTIMISFYKLKGSLSVKHLNILKG